MKKFKYSCFPSTFFLLSLILTFSCSEKPTFENIFDPDVSVNAPSDFTYSIPELYKIKLEWIDSYYNETGFKIDKKVNTVNWQEHYVILETDETSWIDTLAGINDTLQYRICAIFDENYSNYLVTEKINNIFPTPSDLNCTPIDIDQIELEWTDNCIGEDGFIIEQKENTGSFTIVGTTSQNNYIASNLSFDSDYIFRVKAFSGNNFSDYSNEFSINIKQAISSSNLQGNVLLDEIEIHWTDNCLFETGFIIQRKKEGEEFETIYTNIVNDTIYIDTTVEILKRYYYRVATECENYQSEWSNEIELLFNPENAIIVDCNGGGDYLTIQSGIDAADNGDLIIVKEGTYYEKINFNGKNITIASLFFITQDPSYISQTIIDGSQSYGSLVIFENDENSTCVLNGFTITNGTAYTGGGGIYCSSSSPSLTNITITGNSTHEDGGGIYCYYSDPTLTNVTLTDNSADSNGGGIRCSYSSPILTNVTITDNSASNGGGIFLSTYPASLENVIITGNYASVDGGGIYCSSSSPSLTNVTISDNSASVDGGGIYCYNSYISLSIVTISGNIASNGGGLSCFYSSPTLTKVTITGNTATGTGYLYYGGGGISCEESNPSLTNVIITGNTSYLLGGGIYSWSNSYLGLTNVTITGNTSEYYDGGGGISCWDNSTVSIINCILWNDTPHEIAFYYYGEPNLIYISYSDIQGGLSGIDTNNNGTVNWQTGNINSNPLFINSGDFHLQTGSPCINAGNPATQYNDPDGSRNDMGAYGGPGGDW